MFGLITHRGGVKSVSKDYCTLELHMSIDIYKRAKIAAAISEMPFKRYCIKAVLEDSIFFPDVKKINFFRGNERKKKGDKDCKVVKMRVKTHEYTIFKIRCNETRETIIDLVNRTLKEKLEREGF